MSSDVIKKADIESALGDLAKAYPNLVDGMLEREYEQRFWENNNAKSTPSDVLRKRVGSKDESGNNVVLEYFTESYTLNELDKRFPGWSMDEMKLEYIKELRTFIVTGYLFVHYPTPTGTKTIKRFAVGSAIVQVKKATADIAPEPSQPDDSAKAALTEWVKIAGKRVGIGLDIYSQEVTPALEAEFYSLIEGIEPEHTETLVATWETVYKGSAARDFIKAIPPKELKDKLLKTLSYCPPGKENVKASAWKKFFGFNAKNPENIKQCEAFIKQLEDALVPFNQKS